MDRRLWAGKSRRKDSGPRRAAADPGSTCTACEAPAPSSWPRDSDSIPRRTERFDGLLSSQDRSESAFRLPKRADSKDTLES